MGIWQALGFMLMGGGVVLFFDRLAWKMYKDGKREAMEIWRTRK